MESQSIFSHILGALSSIKKRASSLTTITKVVENKVKSGDVQSLKQKVKDSLKAGTDLGLVQAINGFYTLSLNPSQKQPQIKDEVNVVKNNFVKPSETVTFAKSDPELGRKRRKSEMKQDFVKLGKDVNWILKLNRPETMKAKFSHSRGKTNWKRLN